MSFLAAKTQLNTYTWSVYLSVRLWSNLNFSQFPPCLDKCTLNQFTVQMYTKSVYCGKLKHLGKLVLEFGNKGSWRQGDGQCESYCHMLSEAWVS